MRTRRPRKVKLGRYLGVKEEYVDKIVKGEKRTTIRRGIVSPSRQRVFLKSDGVVWGEATIDSVTYTKLGRLREEDARMDGFNSLKELREELSRIYPGISPEEWVTIINFRVSRIYGNFPLGEQEGR